MDKYVVRMRHEKLMKKTSKKKLSSLIGRLILYTFVVIVVVWLGMQVFNFCVFQAIRTVEAQTGILTATAKAKGVLLYQEEVVRAPISGELELLAAEGTRLSIDTAVARIKSLTGPDGSTDSIEINSPSTGVVCYLFDGWEGVYEHISWKRTDPVLIFNNITEESKAQNEASQKEVINKGDPVFKIIDNLVNPYVIIQFAADYSPHVNVGERLQLTWGKEKSGHGEIISVIDKKDSMYALVELEQVRPFPCQRFLELELICRKGEGVIVPDSALVKEDGENGVFIMSVVGPVLKNVEVVAVLDGQAAVQGISPGADVVKNPGLARLIKKDI